MDGESGALFKIIQTCFIKTVLEGYNVIECPHRTVLVYEIWNLPDGFSFPILNNKRYLNNYIIQVL